MPLLELKTYKPVCDHCGDVGSMWTNLPANRQREAVPEGWRFIVVIKPSTGGIRWAARDDHDAYDMVPTELWCSECLEKESESTI